MAGSIEVNAALYRKKAFTYVPPSPPTDLMESTSFTIDFASRKFIHIGLDSKDFSIVALILTSSRYVTISYEFLRRIFSYMGHILSFILDIPEKYKRVIFCEDDLYKLSSMVYRGENVLVIEGKSQEGCRILLNRADLIILQYLEGVIFETVCRTGAYNHQLIIKQVRDYAYYLEEKFNQMQSPPVNLDEMITFIKKDHDYRLIQSDPVITKQIQLFAAAHVADLVLKLRSQNSHEVNHKYIITCRKNI